MSPAAPSRSPAVSVLVCTINRQDNVVPTIRSVQRCGFENFELLVLDQSKDDATQMAVRPLCEEDPRIRLLRLPLPGKPRALNVGRGQARAPYLALTDDDCEVNEGWLGAMVAAFDADPSVGCVYGDVTAGPHEKSQGFIPTCRIERPDKIDRLSQFLTMPNWQHFGIGASMGLRASVVERIGGWDECIGPGTKFGSGDDNDIAVKVLRDGQRIAFVPEARVVHHGFRFWKSSKGDARRTGFGLGAIFAKHLRCGVIYPGALRAVTDALTLAGKRALRGERPLGLTYPASWLRGMAAGLSHPIDRRSNSFVSRSDEEIHLHSGKVAEVVLRRDRSSD
jgi:GT2 family glycosyltransferase